MSASDSLEITLQHERGQTWPVAAELQRPGELARRSEGRLVLPPGCADGESFAAALTERLDRPRDYGTLLGEALFAGAIRDAFVTARAGGAGLRVLLVVEDPALRPLRWERLCAPDGLGGWDFLALDQSTPYARYLPSLTDRRFPAIGRRDLRALVVLADPPPDNPYGLAPIEVGPSAEAIATALGEIPHDRLGPVPGALGPASLDALGERITAGGYTLLHLLAHGAVRRDGETVVYLLDAAGAVAPVIGSDLIRRLGRVGAHRGLPHLAFLATCEGAQPEAETALGGLAQRLVRELGVPAVVAMTDRVSIDTAGALAAAFYTRLRETGEPALALVQAGAALQGRRDILVPALFERLAGRPLFSDRLDGERALTPAEIAFGLERLGALLAERAPVLAEPFEAHARALRASLPTDTAALSPTARAERQAALDGLDALAQEALDSSLPALALDQPVPAWDGRCPFPGLKAFQRAEQAFFFGREPLVATLTVRLRGERFLAVLGASGSGKSSLVLAGLVPGFCAGERHGDGTPAQRVRTLTPGADPESALTRALTAPLADGHDTLLVVDQFEELFTLCTDPARRGRFVEGLVAAWQRQPRLYVVLTMRADFWGDCAPYPALKTLMQAHQELIAPMDTGELRAAMEQQAAAVGLRFEADLSHTILAEVEGEPGAMPLLQHLLLELWRRRHGRWLRASEYRALGGIRQAIAHTAEALHAELDGAGCGQQLLRGLFVRLTRLDEAESEPGQFRDTRQRVALRDLVPAGTDPERVRAVVARLADARLLITTTDADTGETQVEVSHEALIRHWPRLRGWLDEDRASWILLANVRQQAQDWQANGEHDSDLPRWGERLQAAQTLFAQPRFAPTESERRFVDAARELDTRERAAEERQRRERQEALEQAAAAEARAAEQARRRARIAWIGTAVSAGLLAVAVALGVMANAARNAALDAERQARAQAREARYQAANVFWAGAVAAREADPLAAAHGFARAAEAFHETGYPERSANALIALRQVSDRPRLMAVLAHRGRITSADYAPSGDRVVTTGADQSARVWDARTGEALTPPLGHGDVVEGAIFDPSGTRVLTWGWDGQAKLWSAATGQELVPSMGHDDAVHGGVFDGSGGRILTRSGSRARLWDTATGEPLGPVMEHDAPVRGALFGPEDRRVLTWGEDGKAWLWDADSREPLIPPLEHGDPVGEARFGPDGATLLTWSGETGPRVWDAANGRELTNPGMRLVPAGASAAGVAFSDDASKAAVWLGGLEAQVTELPSGVSRLSIAHPERILGARLEGPHGETALTWARDGSVAVTRRSAAFRQDLPGARDGVSREARLSDDGERLLTAESSARGLGLWGADRQVRAARVWNPHAGVPLTPPLAHDATRVIARFAPRGTQVLTQGDDDVRLWDANADRAGPVHPSARPDPRRFQGSEAVLADVSNGRVTLLLPEQKAELRGQLQSSDVLRTTERTRAARVSPDGEQILTWLDSDTVERWSARTGEPLAPPLAVRAVSGARFSTDGRRILTWARDGAARLWDATDGHPVGPTMRHDFPLSGAELSADGSRVLTWDSLGFMRIWDAATGAPLTSPVRHPPPPSGSGETGQLDARFSPDGSRIYTRDAEGGEWEWDLGDDPRWPRDALVLGVEAETGTRLSEGGELVVLDGLQWRGLRFCDYDAIRHALGRLDDAAWDQAQRLCRAARGWPKPRARIRP